MSDTTTKHYIINYNDITNIPFIDIDNEKLQVINNKLTTIYADTNLRQGKNINISLDGFINVTNTFINDNDINKIYYNGNVGIGTTNPSSLLNIYDSINSSNLLNISENGLILDTNINVVKNTIEIGSSTSKINKINCNFLNNIDTSFLTEDNLKNNIFYTRTDINGITSGITTTINTKSTDNRAYTTEIFTNSSNYTNEEIVQVTSELETYSDTQISTALNNSSNYSKELFINSSNYNKELFTNSSNYGEELSINSSNYIDKEITRVSGDVIINAFDTNIRTELPSLKITGTYTDTQLLEQLAEETTGVNGWRIVRFLPPTATAWHPTNDNLVGTAVYGTAYDYSVAWSVVFGNFDEFVFGTGGLQHWMWVKKQSITNANATNNPIIKSSKSNTAYSVPQWYVGTNAERPLISLNGWDSATSGASADFTEIMYIEGSYQPILNPSWATDGGMCVWVRNSADKYSSVNIIGNIANASGIILKSDVNSTIDSKSFIILKSANGSVNDGIKIYNYKDDNLLISTNNNDIYSPTVILNNRRMILGYDTSEYFATPNTEIYNRTNTLEIKGDININGNLKKNNETINLNIWSTQTNNVNYIGDIIFKDTNSLTNTAYTNGSLVTIAGDLSSNKQGLIIEKSDRTQRIGITDCSIKQLGSSTNAKLLITSKGDLPVSIGNETNNTLQIYENRALVNNKFGVNTGQKTLIVPLQVGLGTNTSGATSRSSVAILSGDSGGATELCALSLINSRQGALGTACSLGFNLSNEWGPSVKINAISTNVPHTADLIFSTHNGTSLTEKMRILANGNIGIGISAPSEKLHINGGLKVSSGNITTYDSLNLFLYGSGNSEKGIFFRSDHSSENKKYNSSILIYDHGGGVNGSTPDGISINAWDGISFCTASNTRNERMRIASNGNVGIGISNPSDKLEVNGSSTIIHTSDTIGGGGLYLAHATNNRTWNLRMANTQKNLHFDSYTTGWNTNMSLLTNGNVGIGTTPNTKLQIYNSSTTPATGANTIGRTTAPTEVLRLQSKHHTGHGSGALMRFTNHNNSGDNPSNDEYNLAAIAGIDDDNNWGGGMVFYTVGKGNSGGGDLVPRILINSDGNVGIGTESPSYKLDVSGDIHASNNIYIGNNTNDETKKSIYFGGTYGDNTYDHCVIEKRVYGISAPSEKQELLLFSGNDKETAAGPDRIRLKGSNILFDVLNNGTDRITENTKMIIIDNGNVGIGTTSPATKLDVRGNMRLGDGSTVEQDINFVTSSGNWQVGTNNSGNGTNSNQFFIYDSEYRLTVQKATGNVGIGTTSPAYKLEVNGSFNCTELTVDGNDINSLINIGTDIFEGNDTKVSIGTTEKYDNAILSIDVGDEGTMLSSPDKSQFLWRIKHDQKWGMYWSTEGSGNNYYINNNSNPNQIVFVGGGTETTETKRARAAIDLDNGAFWSKDWYHIEGDGGIKWQNYGGGWMMNDSDTIKVHGTKDVKCTNNLYVDERIGIGTNSPSGKLHIYESSGTVHSSTNGTIILEHGNSGGASSIIFKSKVNHGSDYGYIQYQDSSTVNAVGEEAKLIIGTQNDSNDDVILLPSGNVGVGTTEPNQKLDVNGSIKLTGEIIKASTNINYIKHYFNNNSLSITGTNDALNNNTVVGVHIAKYSTNYGYIDIRSSDNDGGWIDFSKTGNSDYKTRIRGYNDPAKLVFYVDGGNTEERVVISSNVTNINNKLKCNDTIETDQIVIKGTNPLLDIAALSNSNPVINIRLEGRIDKGFKLQLNGENDSFSFAKNTGGGSLPVYTISSTRNITFSEDVKVNKILTVTGNTSIEGNITVTGTSNLSNTLTVGPLVTGATEKLIVNGKARITNELLCENDIIAFANISDKRFKTNISSFDNDDIDVVNRLNPVKFIWKENLFNSNMANKPDIGFIAQEVKEVIPEAVSVCKIEMNDIDYNYIKYERIIPYLVNNIKELNNKNKNLENKIENLESKNLKLENELEKIKKYLNI